jgi:hypothetical protein
MTTPDDSPGMFSGIFGRAREMLFIETPQPGTGTPAQSPNVDMTAVVAAGAPPAEMVQKLSDLVMSKPSAYTELLDAIAPLAQFIPDEGSRFKAAFAIVGKKRTVEEILKAIDLQHNPALEDQEQGFASQAAAQEGIEVGRRERSIADLQNQVKVNADDAARLRAQFEERMAAIAADDAAKNAQIAELVQEVATHKASIAQAAAQFGMAAAAVREQIKTARDKVSAHLAGA